MLIPPRTWVFQKPMQSLAQQFSTPYVKKKIDLKLYIKTTKYIFQVCSTWQNYFNVESMREG